MFHICIFIQSLSYQIFTIIYKMSYNYKTNYEAIQTNLVILVCGEFIMKIEKLPNFLYTDDFNNISGLHVSTQRIGNIKAHRHEFYELEFILEGETVCIINGETYHLQEGDFVFITPLDVHSYTPVGNQKTLFATVHFHLENLHNDFTMLSELSTSIIRKDAQIKEAFEILINGQKDEPFQYLMYRNILERIMILFLQKGEHDIPHYVPKEITYALGYINSHFSMPLTLDSISQMCQYSPSYFCKQFKQYTGKRFIEYLTEVRIKHARNMLINQKLSVTQISYECGFGSTRNLHRIFRRKYGCSPVEYLKRFKDSKGECGESEAL